MEAIAIPRLCRAGGVRYEDHSLIGCVEDGSIRTPSAFTSADRDLLKRRKLSGPNFHALRHAHVSHVLKDGVKVRTLDAQRGIKEAAKRTDAGLRKALESRTRVVGSAETTGKIRYQTSSEVDFQGAGPRAKYP
jgi:integrase